MTSSSPLCAFILFSVWEMVSVYLYLHFVQRFSLKSASLNNSLNDNGSAFYIYTHCTAKSIRTPLAIVFVDLFQVLNMQTPRLYESFLIQLHFLLYLLKTNITYALPPSNVWCHFNIIHIKCVVRCVTEAPRRLHHHQMEIFFPLKARLSNRIHNAPLWFTWWSAKTG